MAKQEYVDLDGSTQAIEMELLQGIRDGKVGILLELITAEEHTDRRTENLNLAVGEGWQMGSDKLRGFALKLKGLRIGNSYWLWKTGHSIALSKAELSSPEEHLGRTEDRGG